MTEQEAIYCLKAVSERYPQVCEECQLYGQTGCDHCYDDANDVAIKALEEISLYKQDRLSLIPSDTFEILYEELEQYRALGTIEQIKALQDDYWKLNEMCKDYSALGTVEELRVARDKQVAKKLTHEATLHWCPTCPSCKNVLSEFMKFNDEKLLDATKHCKFCGQKLDWSDEDDI